MRIDIQARADAERLRKNKYKPEQYSGTILWHKDGRILTTEMAICELDGKHYA